MAFPWKQNSTSTNLRGNTYTHLQLVPTAFIKGMRSQWFNFFYKYFITFDLTMPSDSFPEWQEIEALIMKREFCNVRYTDWIIYKIIGLMREIKQHDERLIWICLEIQFWVNYNAISLSYGKVLKLSLSMLRNMSHLREILTEQQWDFFLKPFCSCASLPGCFHLIVDNFTIFRI